MRNGLKARIGALLTVLLLLVCSVPAFAAEADGTDAATRIADATRRAGFWRCQNTAIPVSTRKIPLRRSRPLQRRVQIWCMYMCAKPQTTILF